jgi:hypothetical protein
MYGNTLRTTLESWVYHYQTTKQVDICSALRDVYMTLQENTEAGITLLSLLATVLVGAAEGQGNEIIEEVAVIEAMRNFDHRLRGVLDEGH